MGNYEEMFASLECEPVEDLFPHMISKEELLIEYGKLLVVKKILTKEKYINERLLRTILDVEYEGDEDE